MNKTWTPEAVIEDMKLGIKMFGTYTFSDKGPYETMDYHSQVSYLLPPHNGLFISSYLLLLRCQL